MLPSAQDASGVRIRTSVQPCPGTHTGSEPVTVLVFVAVACQLPAFDVAVTTRSGMLSGARAAIVSVRRRAPRCPGAGNTRTRATTFSFVHPSSYSPDVAQSRGQRRPASINRTSCPAPIAGPEIRNRVSVSLIATYRVGEIDVVPVAGS